MMASEPIHIHDDSELARLFDEAGDEPVTVERKGKYYRVASIDPVRDDWSEERRQAVLNALEAFAGSWSDIDADTVIEDLYAARLAGTRPQDRP
jgi:hypothetical protein